MKPLMQCAILVGGLGTRLGALTQETPKPLLPIGRRLFIDYVLDAIVRHGLNEVVCLAGYHSAKVREWMRNVRIPGVNLSMVVEPEPWGTAGALIAAKDIIHDEFLLLNGDSIFDINLLDMTTWQPKGEW